MENHEGSVLVKKGLRCEECGKDNMSLYSDGHTYCFSGGCGKRGHMDLQGTTRPSAKPSKKVASVASNSLLKVTIPDLGFQKRQINTKTLAQTGVGEAGYSGQKVQVYPYYDQKGNLVHQKLRLPGKEFSVVSVDDAPELGKCQLFMQNVFGDRYDRQLIITEGELDALSVAQALDFKVAVVSITSGAKHAAKSLKANYLWVDRFEDIVLWLDNDADGLAAMEECAQLFKVGKVRIAKAPEGYKDASDLLQDNLPGDIKQTVYAAAKWRPRGIVNASDHDGDVMAPKDKEPFWAYPPMMEKLQEMTGGMFEGEVTYHVAGTGVGKSSALREIEYELAVNQKVPIAVLSFEDTIRDAKFGIMSIHANERLQLVPVPDPEDTAGVKSYDDRMRKLHAEAFGAGNVYLFDPQTAEWQMEAILGYVRYCAKALDCKFVILDPISFIAAGLSMSDDERRVLDYVAKEFAKLAKELGIHIIVAHHLKRTMGVPHEEGAPTSLNEMRSSGGMANFATGVIGWERNNQAAGDAWRVTQARILKPIRRTGRSGLADVLYYTEQGRLIKSPIPFPPIGKPKGDEQPSKPFGPADDY